MHPIGRKITTLLVALFCPLFASTTLARQETKATYIAGKCVIGSPLAEMHTSSQARQRASKLAASIPGAFVVRGRGNSMLPLYRSGTLLVIKPMAYEDLSRGMSVVFRKNNRSVTHVLVAKTKDGWRTAGLNNRRHDFVSVNSSNIRGVVVAAFTPVKGVTVAMR